MGQTHFHRMLSVFSGQPRKRRIRSRIVNTPGLESLEPRKMLAAQVITTLPSVIDVQAGAEIAFDVKLDTLPANTKSNGFAFGLHFDSTKLTFVRIENQLQDSLFSAGPPPVADTGNTDGLAATDMRIQPSWSSFTNITFPPNLPATLFRAVFTAKTGFAAGTSTKVGFSQTNAPVDSTGTPFTFQKTDLTVNSITTPPPAHILTTVPSQLNVRPGAEVAFDVKLDTLPANTKSNGFAFGLHFDSSKLTFVRLENQLQDSLFNPGPPPVADTGNTDGLAATDMRIQPSWSSFTNVTFPPNLPVTLFRAVFTARTDFAVGTNTMVGFSQTNQAVDSTGKLFTFQKTDLTITSTATPAITGGDGNVTVSYRNGHLSVVGERGNNSIQISGGATSITIRPLGNTTVNGSLTPFVVPGSAIPGNMNIEMRRGNDKVGLQDLTVNGNLNVMLGLGDDVLEMKNVRGSNSLTVYGGLGNDRISVIGSSFSQNVAIFGMGGHDKIGLKGVNVGHNLTAAGGYRAGGLIVDTTVVGNDAVLTGGIGKDSIGLKGTTIRHNLRLNGSGGRDTAQFQNVTVDGSRNLRGVTLVGATDAVFAQLRTDLFDSLLFG